MRVRMVMLLALGACLGAAFWSAIGLAAARTASRQAMDDLGRVRVLAARIAQLRENQPLAPQPGGGEADLSARIELAAAAAELPTQQLLRIDPLPSVREVQGDGDYVLTPTRVEIASAPLDRLLRLAHRLLTDDPALSLTAARFSLQEDDTGEPATAVWDCELTLTQRKYLPN